MTPADITKLFEAILPPFDDAALDALGKAAKSDWPVDDAVRHALNMVQRFVGLHLVSTASGQTRVDPSMRGEIFGRLATVTRYFTRAMRMVDACGHTQWVTGAVRALFELRNTGSFGALRGLAENVLGATHVKGLQDDLAAVGIDYHAGPSAAGASPTAPSNPAPPSGTATYRIMSSNLEAFRHYDAFMRGDHAQEVFDRYFRVANPVRVANFVRTLREEMPDVMCLQEADVGGWMQALDANPEAKALLVEYHSARFDEASLVTFVRRPLTIAQFFNEAPARAQVVLVDDNINGNHFAVLNTHARFDAMRRCTNEYQSLIRRAHTLPLVACGDFNTDYGATPMQLFKQSGGNENLAVMQHLLFPASEWTYVTDTLPFTSRSVVGLDVFEKIDHILVRTHQRLEKAEVSSVCPPPEKAHRMLPLAVTESRERPAAWREREDVQRQGMKGSPPVLYNAAGQWDKHSPENHYSDHAAIIAAVTLRGSPPTLPKLVFKQQYSCRFEAHRLCPRDQVLVVDADGGNARVYAVPAAPLSFPVKTPAMECHPLPPDVYFLRSSLGHKSPFGTCLLHYIVPGAAVVAPRPCAFNKAAGAIVFIDGGQVVPGQTKPVAQPAPPGHPAQAHASHGAPHGGAHHPPPAAPPPAGAPPQHGAWTFGGPSAPQPQFSNGLNQQQDKLGQKY